MRPLHLAFLASLLLVEPSFAWQALVACGKHRFTHRCQLQMGFFDQLSANLQQMGSALTPEQGNGVFISHVMLRTDEAARNYRTRGECYELLSVWKERIDGDEDKFSICAQERSECQSRSRGGELGFITQLSRDRMSSAFSSVVFQKDGTVADPGCYGPVESDQGLHLVFVHAAAPTR